MFKFESPVVSVILPVYNGERYLQACIYSILNQTYKNFELIVVNDGSSDRTKEIINFYARLDKRVKAFHLEKNGGVAAALNFAISQAKAKYIAVMNDDDVMARTRLSKQVKFLNQNPGHVLIGGQVNMIDENGKFIRAKTFPLVDEEIRALMYMANPVQHSSAMINRELLPETFVWYDEQMIVSEDLDLLFKLAQYGKFAHLSEIVLDYRVRGNSLSHSNPRRMYNLAYAARKRGAKLYGFKPDIKSQIFLELSTLLVNIIPNGLIFPTFYLIRAILLKLESKKAEVNAGQLLARYEPKVR